MSSPSIGVVGGEDHRVAYLLLLLLSHPDEQELRELLVTSSMLAKAWEHAT